MKDIYVRNTNWFYHNNVGWENGLFSDKVVAIISPQCYLSSTMLEIIS